jgi:hypothetical protein
MKTQNKQIITSSLGSSSLADNNCLHPNFVTGFTDAEGCFMVKLRKDTNRKMGFQVILCFAVSLHKKDLGLLESLKAYFNGCGLIRKEREDSVKYQVYSIEDLAVIVDHFDKYPLISQKLADYLEELLK